MSDIIVGFELHLPLKCDSKLFCSCPTLPIMKPWVKVFLEEKGASFEFVEHEPVARPVDSARARGVKVNQIAKALVYVADKEPILFVLSGDRKLDVDRAKEFLGVSDLRMATPEEVKGFTGAVVGLVPPTIEGIRKVVDNRLLANNILSFNAGISTGGIKIEKEELLRVLDNYSVSRISEDSLIKEKPTTESKVLPSSENIPNSRVCPTCLGMPGSKPVTNKKAIDYAIKLALALNCKIEKEIVFSRKTYFYPDMNKNFQISQYEIPVGRNGFISLNSGKKIRIRRVHLEEDPGALIHKGGIYESKYVLVDYNRAGIPLCEIVTEPDISSQEEAKEFLDKLKTIVDYLGIFDIEKFVIKADTNISIKGGQRVEIKNITGTKSIEKALAFEVLRQKNELKQGKSIERETRGFDEATGLTRTLRRKETEEDYGFIIDTDLVPVIISEQWIAKIRKKMPELPEEKINRFIRKYKLSEYDASVLCSDLTLSNLFEEIAKDVEVKLAARFLTRELLAILNYNNLNLKELKLNSKEIISLLQLLQKGKITEKNAKEAMILYANKKIKPVDFIKENNLLKDMKKKEIDTIVAKILKENKQAIEDYRKGETKALHFLVGLVMKETKGKAEPRGVEKMIRKRLK